MVVGKLSNPEPQVKMVQIPEGSLDLPQYLIAHNISFKEKKEPTRTIYTLQKCLWSENHTTKSVQGDSAIIQGIDGKLGYQCFHNHCSDKTWADARRKISGEDSLAQFCKGHQEPKDETNKVRQYGEPCGAFEIIEHPLEPDEFYIEPFMQAGDQGFLTAQYKTGKTQWMIQEALCLCCQKPFLGMTISKSRRVFYLRFELKESRFRQRFTTMLHAMGGPGMIKEEPYFQFVRGFDIRKEPDFNWLLQTIDRLKTEVLLIDPFYKLSPSTKLREDEGTETIKKWDRLKARFPKIHIQVAHHPRKSTGGMPDNGWDSSYGSMFHYANMDYEIKLTRKGHDGRFELSHISNDMPIGNLTFKRNPFTLLYEFETEEDIQGRWTQDTPTVIEQVRTGMNTKTNLGTYIQTTLKYKQKEAKDFLEFLLKERKLLWVGSATRGRFKMPDPEGVDKNVEKGFFNSNDFNQFDWNE